MIITLTEVNQEKTSKGSDYFKVKGMDDNGKERTCSIFNNLEAKWPLLKPKTTLEFKMEKKGQYWNVVDINPVNLPAKADTANAKTEPLVEAARKAGAEIIGSTDDTRIRSMALAYSKDLAVAGKIEIKDIGKLADKFIDYILNIKQKEES